MYKPTDLSDIYISFLTNEIYYMIICLKWNISDRTIYEENMLFADRIRGNENFKKSVYGNTDSILFCVISRWLCNKVVSAIQFFFSNLIFFFIIFKMLITNLYISESLRLMQFKSLRIISAREPICQVFDLKFQGCFV